MRILKFIVKNQVIEKDPKCDFSGLVPGTKGYVRAEFSFSPEWTKYTKIACFYSILGKEYPAQIMFDGKSCMIPVEALQKKSFKIQIFGNSKTGTKILTNKVTIKQDGGKV